MKKVYTIDTISEYNGLVNQETFHPLVSIIDFSKTGARRQANQESDADALSLGFYAVFLKRGEQCTLRYGRKNYDYQDGTLVFLAPQQVVQIIRNPDAGYSTPGGYALLFHPDLLFGTSLGQRMKEFSFFSYEVNEALHISERERSVVVEAFQKIDDELRRGIDKHSRKLIVANIELFLDYCVRFYDRQFIMREPVHHSVLEKFDGMVSEYLHSSQSMEQGLPSVSFFADKLNLSANYLGDLIRKETGKSAQEHIQLQMIVLAKEKIQDPRKSISEIAYELGFKYPQHFTRMFKKSTGMSPNEYRGYQSQN